ncbi:hypothetical protein BD560DRAFT_421809 [Blakeslea trispora]|nr:hypothetical protein BD560DRAFT_421809 [Blakeslea trispora]
MNEVLPLSLDLQGLKIWITSHPAILYVQSTPSPEAKFFVALKECFPALCWVLKHGHSIRLNEDNNLVLSDSVGVISSKFDIFKVHQLFSNGAYGSKKFQIDLLQTHYFPKLIKTLYAAPLLAKTEQLKDLPFAPSLLCEAYIRIIYEFLLSNHLDNFLILVVLDVNL